MKIIFILFFLLFYALSYSQSDTIKTASISGSVLFEVDKQPVENATIQLLKINDSTVIKSAATDKKGFYKIDQINRGNYLLKISFISFETEYYEIKRKDFNKEVIVIPPVTLEEKSILLSDAVIIGQIPEVIVKEDTLEYNPAAFKLENSALVEDLLKRLPGVEVDADGGITIGGKTIRRVTVDGENFFGNDPKMSTRNLEIDIIDKLQIIEKKSDLEELTGIDDGERETIINLTIKKDRKKGWINNIQAGMGSLVEDISADNLRYATRSMINKFSEENKYSLVVNANNNSERGQGITSTGSFGLNLINVFSEKFKMTGGVSYNTGNSLVDRNSFRQNILIDSVSYRKSESSSRNKNHNLSAEYRFEYKPFEKTTIIFNPNISLSKSHSNDSSYTSTMAGDAIQSEVNQSRRRGTGNSDNLNLTGHLILSQEFTKKGRKATMSFQGDYRDNRNNGTNISTNLFFLMPERNSVLNQESITHSSSNSFSFNGSYVEPILNNNFFQFSYTYRNNNSENLRNTFDFDPNTADFSNLNFDYSKSLYNQFTNQTISLSFRSVRAKYNYNAGINVEPSNIRSKSFIADAISEGVDSVLHDPGARKVVNYAPNADMTYRFSSNRNIRLTYRGRTLQPSISQLDPTEDITNPLHTRTGNADLLPSFTNNFSLLYNFSDREKHQSMRASINFSFVVNEIINKTIYEANTGIQKTYPINQNGIWNGSAGLIYNTPLDKQKKFQFSTNLEASFRNQIGYMSFRSDSETKNNAQTLSIRENLSLSYRQSWLYLQIRGIVRYSTTHNSLELKKNQEDLNYSASLNAQINFPFDWQASNNIRYSGQTGLSTGFNRNETIWDIDVSKKLLKNKQAMLSLRWTDLLQQRLSIRRSVTSSYIEDSESNVLTGYFLVSFSYRFNSMGGKRGRNERMNAGRRSGQNRELY